MQTERLLALPLIEAVFIPWILPRSGRALLNKSTDIWERTACGSVLLGAPMTNAPTKALQSGLPETLLALSNRTSRSCLWFPANSRLTFQPRRELGCA